MSENCLFYLDPLLDFSSNFSEQSYGGTTYFIPENQKQTHVVYPPYMAYPGVPTDTSVAFMERTTQMKVNARTSFFVGEGTWFEF